jgi:hypothetical protein
MKHTKQAFALIQGGEENFLQSRSKIKKKKHGGPKLATEDIAKARGLGAPQQRPQEGNDVHRRHCQDREIKGFSPKAIARGG